MLGAIIGDICGSAYEFNNVKRKDIDLFPAEAKFTDDTVMTVAVSMALIDSMMFHSIDITENAIIESMRYFGHLFPGAGYGEMFYEWLKSSSPKPYNSFGNGSAMRVSSVGWLFPYLRETIYRASYTANVTHNHPEGKRGAQAIAGAIFLARNGKSKEEIREFITDRIGYNLDFTLDEIRDDYYHDETCQNSVPQAIEAFLESTDFEDAIRCAISIGGDSDTIADMTGAIAEAYYGIPDWMKEKAMDILPYPLKTHVNRFYEYLNHPENFKESIVARKK